jgi:hypothetical protein
LLTLLSCLPPSKSVSRKVFTISIASSVVRNLAGKLSTLALLCCRDKEAISLFQHNAALTPSYLLATILTPFPDPQIIIPFSSFLFEISFAKG